MPTWLAIARCPMGIEPRPGSGIRPAVGLSPTIPQNAAGTRHDPPRSVPRPNGDPPAAMMAACPPEEPPGERVGSSGWFDRPYRGLSLSKYNKHCATFVFP